MTDFERAREAVAKMDAARESFRILDEESERADWDESKFQAWQDTFVASEETSRAAEEACIAYVRSGGWRPLTECPDTGEVVMFYVNNWTETFRLARASDYHSMFCMWRDDAIAWQRLIPPPPSEKGAP